MTVAALLLRELTFGLHLARAKLGEAFGKDEEGQGAPVNHELLGRLTLHRYTHALAAAPCDAIGSSAPAQE